MKSFTQGYLDHLCGIYSICNSDRIVNRSSVEDSQVLFNILIDYLEAESILSNTIKNGVDQKLMRVLIYDVAAERFPYKVSDKKNFDSLKKWWNFSRDFLENGESRAIILSTGGIADHLSTVYRMTERRLFFLDSSTGESILNRSLCALKGYSDEDKYIIYPSQCWYLGKE